MLPSVPIGYLIPVFLVAWCTYFLMAPRHWPRVFNSLGLHYAVNELPFLALLWVYGSIWLTFIEGELNSPFGWLFSGMMILASLGLVRIIRRGLQATPLVSRALDDGLGEEWHATSSPKLVKRLNKRFTANALLGPFFVRRPDVKRVANISYGDAGARNLLDVYHHRSRPLNGPILVHLHGGAFVSGKKNRQALPLIYRLASKGWVCISANYRLSPHAKFPDHLIDVKKIITWARNNGHKFGADPAQIFISGSSAGGHLAALAALTPNNPTFQPGFESEDTTVIAAISLYGYYGALDTKSELPSSPLDYSEREAPPFFVVHGDKDTMVPVESARDFAKHLDQSSNNPVIYAELPGAEHVFDMFHSIRNEAVQDGIEVFAAWVRAARQRNRD